MTFGIMLIPDYKRALKGIFRVLRQNGYVAITVWKTQGHWDYLSRAARIVLEDDSYPPPQFFHKKWLSGEFVAKLLLQIGFRYDFVVRVLMRNVKVHEQMHMWKWGSKEAFVQFVGRNPAPSIQAYMESWTSQQKEDICVMIHKLLDLDFPQSDTFRVPMVANIVVGRKK